MALIGYARVSTEDQSLSPQRDALRAAGCTEVFEEFASGAQRSHPQLTAAHARVRRGDTLLVARIDRSVAHLLAVIEALEAKGSHFRSLHDPVDTRSSQGLFSLHVLGAVAQLERALIAERTKAGLRAAGVRRQIGGNPGLYDPGRHPQGQREQAITRAML